MVRALYGIKRSGTAFGSFFAEQLYNKGFKSSIEDPDDWMREDTKSNSEEYYKYTLVYVDYVLAI